MRKVGVFLLLLGSGVGFFAVWYFLGFSLPAARLTSPPEAHSTTNPALPSEAELKNRMREIQYRTETLPESVVHVLIVPAQAEFKVIPAISETVATIDQFAQKTQAIAAINAGFFDPENQRSTSYITV